MVKIRYLDGRRFRRAVLAGIERLQDKKDHLNRINVYPVPDADTGTNMSLTMASVAEALRRSRGRSIHEATRNLAESAILGSQGNSGAILAQFFQGLAEGFQGKLKISTKDFAAAVEQGEAAAYAALAQPREGTILTTIKDWCRAIKAKQSTDEDFVDLLKTALQEARASVLRTPEQLPVLKEYGVVDAGAEGFLHLLEGITSYVETGNVRDLVFADVPSAPESFAYEHPPMTLAYRYCTECMVEAAHVPREDAEALLSALGDSVVIVSGERLLKVHVHTNDPESVFASMARFGPILQRKAQDMQTQHEDAVSGGAAVAILADSACDLPEGYARANAVRYVPLRVSFGDKVFLDKMELSPETFLRECESSPHHPKTSQPPVGDYLKAFEDASAGGRDMVVVSLSGGVSGTLNAARAAASQFKGAMVTIVDSGNLSVAQGLLVQEAREMALQGFTSEQIAARLSDLRRQLSFFVSLRTLDFARRGGRVSFTTSVASHLLGIKPVISFSFERDGKAIRQAVAWGHRGVRAKVVELARREWSRYARFRVAVAHVAAPQLAHWYRDRVTQISGLRDVPIVEASAVLAAHAGPGAAGIAVLGLD